MELKIPKANSPKVMLMLIQDKYLKDNHKVLAASSKETKGKLARALISGVEEIHVPQELVLMSSLFPREVLEEGKFIGFALSELNHRA